MQRKHIIIIILFTSTALVGLTITQALFVFKAIEIGKDQHDHRVDVALQEVIDDLVAANEKEIEFSEKPLEKHACE